MSFSIWQCLRFEIFWNSKGLGTFRQVSRPRFPSFQNGSQVKDFGRLCSNCCWTICWTCHLVMFGSLTHWIRCICCCIFIRILNVQLSTPLVLKIWIYFNFSTYLAWSVLVSQILTWAYRSLIVARTKTMRINLWLSRSLGASILSETHLSEHMESALASPQETLSYSRFCFFVLLSLRHETLIKWLGLRCEDVTTKSWFCVAIPTWWP